MLPTNRHNIIHTIPIFLIVFITAISCTQKPFYLVDFDEDKSGTENKLIENIDWKAQWIWMEDTSDVMLARKSFQLKKLPETANIKITASSQYQLFINGIYVLRGPARSAPHHQSFDMIDVRNYLKKKDNVIAVRVHHQKGKYSYYDTGRAGLLVQLDLVNSGIHSSIISDPMWKVSQDYSWDDNSPYISRFQLVVNDHVDLREQIKGWAEVQFNDGEWHNAVALMRNVGWPAPQKNAKAQALIPPWTSLVSRDIPYLTESLVRAENLIQGVQVPTEELESLSTLLNYKIDNEITQTLKSYLQDDKVIHIPPSKKGKKWLLVFDFGKVLNGSPMIDIQGPSGTNMEIHCAPYLINDQFTSKVVDSEFLDKIILSGDHDVWESTYFKPTRYMGIVIQNDLDLVKINYTGIRKISYPFEKRGYIQSENTPWIKQYMDASKLTIDACTTDGFTDNYRERRQYAQTGYYAALGNYWTYGDHALQRRYLIQIAQEQQANGIMPAYAPLAMDDFMVILDSNCLWIRSLHNYLLYSGDKETVKQLLPAARKLMVLLHSYTNSLGLLYNPPYAYWLDHARNDRRGANFCLNGHYLGALDDFAKILLWLGEPDTKKFAERAEKARSSLRDHLWNEEKGLFVDTWIDGALSDQYSEHANAMALAMKVATPEKAGRVISKLLEEDNIDYLKRPSGMTMVTPAMSYFLHKGLCDYGFVNESFDLFRKRFDKMLAPEYNGTLWEEWWLDGTGRSGKFQGGRTRSDAQTESAFTPALIGEYLLGVQPLKPGWEQVSIIFHPSSLKHIEGKIPTPLGDLFVEWKILDDSSKVLEIHVPEGMQVKFKINNLPNVFSESVELDGKELKTDQIKESHLIIGNGKHIIKF
jgi:hypothetical protein